MSLLNVVSVPPPSSPSCGPLIEQSPSIGELLELAIYYGCLVTPPNMFLLGNNLKSRGLDIPQTWCDQGYIGKVGWAGKFEGLWRELTNAGRISPVETSVVINYESDREHREGKWYSYSRFIEIYIAEEVESETHAGTKITRLSLPRDHKRTTLATLLAESVIINDTHWLDHILGPLFLAHPEIQLPNDLFIKFIPEAFEGFSFDNYRGTWTFEANVDLRSIVVNLDLRYDADSTGTHSVSLLEYLFLKLSLLYAEWGLAVLSEADLFVPWKGQIDTLKTIRFAQIASPRIRETSQICEFQSLAFGNTRALAELIDAGDVKPSDVRKLIERFESWRSLDRGSPPNESLTAAYIDELTTIPWVERLPTRAVRFSICTLIGAGLGLAGGGILGTLLGTGLGAADTFILTALGDRRPLVRFGKEVRKIVR